MRQETLDNDNITALLNATIEALLMFDNNICIELNDVALKMFGYDIKSDLIGKNILDIVSKDITQYDTEQLLKNDINHEFELLMAKKNGQEFPAQIKEKNILLKSKNIKIIAVLDLTDIKRKEKLFAEQSKLASMGEMIGNIAHQWRQPLSSISISASNIKVNYEMDMLEDDELVNELDSIVNSTVFLSDTINDFQSFIKGDAIASNFLLDESITKVLKLVDGNIKSADINVVLQIQDNIKLFGLANEFVQVLLNIINNAKDALVENKINNKLIIIKINYDTNKTNAIISIQDNANGIPNHIIDKIFEPYFTTKHKTNGTGLGLYMTNQMINEHMKGKVEVSNEIFTYNDVEYKGALFKISLPINK
jgi:PAS domain S-box-containing protein